jgi:hypothetical protein
MGAERSAKMKSIWWRVFWALEKITKISNA